MQEQSDSNASRARTESESESESSSSEERRAGARPPSSAQKVRSWLKDHGIAQPVGWEGSKVNELVRLPGGPDAVIAAFEEARKSGGAVTCRNYIRWAEQTLAPDSTPRNGTSTTAPKGLGPSSEEARNAFVRK